MKLTNIRLITATVVTALSFFNLPALFSQASRTSYFVESAYIRNSLNPAFRTGTDYMGIPFLTGIGATYQTNTLNLEHFIYELKGERITFMHSDIRADKFLSGLADENKLSVSAGYEIFSMGFHRKEAYWGINLSLKAHGDANIPKTFFDLVKTGFRQDKDKSYDINNTSANINSHLELGLSYSRPFLDNSLILGGRGKLLGGIANFDLLAKNMYIRAGSKQWTAITDVKLNASAPGITPKYKTKSRDREKWEIINGFDFSNWGRLSGFGLGFDIGGIYDFRKLSGSLTGLPAEVLRNLKVSASFNDIGFISWSKGNTAHLVSSDQTTVLTPNDYTIHTDGSTSLGDIFDNVLDDLERAVNLTEQVKSGRATSIRTTMNIGMEYEILPYKLTGGLLYSVRFGNYFNTKELTLSANYRYNEWLASTLSYSFLYSNFNTFGWGVYLTPSKGVHFFLAGDYIIPHVSPQWIPSTSKGINMQLGVAVPL